MYMYRERETIPCFDSLLRGLLLDAKKCRTKARRLEARRLTDMTAEGAVEDDALASGSVPDQRARRKGREVKVFVFECILFLD